MWDMEQNPPERMLRTMLLVIDKLLEDEETQVREGREEGKRKGRNRECEVKWRDQERESEWVCVCLSPLRRWCLIILLQVHGIQLFEYFQDIDFGRVWKFAQSEPVQQGTFVKILQVTTTCTINATSNVITLCQPLLAWIFWADSNFWLPWTIVNGLKGKFEWKRKGQNLWNQRGHAHQTWYT